MNVLTWDPRIAVHSLIWNCSFPHDTYYILSCNAEIYLQASSSLLYCKLFECKDHGYVIIFEVTQVGKPTISYEMLSRVQVSILVKFFVSMSALRIVDAQ